MRICAILGCSNGTYGLKRWKKTDCLIHHCKHGTSRCVCPPPFELFTFPTERRDPESRRQWVKLINRSDKQTGRNWQPTEDSRVCTKHFVDGCPTPQYPYPTLHMGYCVTTSSSTRKGRTPVVRKTSGPVASVDKENFETSSDICDTPVISCESSPQRAKTDHTYAENAQEASCESCQEKQKLLNQLVETLHATENKTASKKSRSPAYKYISTDRKVRNNTGVPNRQALQSLVDFLAPKAKTITYWRGCAKVKTVSTKVRKYTGNKSGPKRKLCFKEELVLVLMKLRLSLTNEFLAITFSISVSTCSSILNTLIRFLAKELAPLVFWPDVEIVRKLLPGSLRMKYPRLRCTLDCTEVFIERPRHLELQALTWSSYKSHNTVKILVVISPNGMVAFLSKAYGGRASDQHIVGDSGFYNLVDPGDVVLADRGFPIQEELLLRHARLEIPPPSSGLEQMSAQNVRKTKAVANARIHVERAIGRMKTFAILTNVLPITLVPLVDDICLICAAICNLQAPLVEK